MAAKWIRAIGLASALALLGAGYAHCLSGNPGLSAAAARGMPDHGLSHSGMAMPDDCDGCDHAQTDADACLAACASAVAVPAEQGIGLAVVASQAIAGFAGTPLPGTDRPPDPHPPNPTAPI